MPVTIVNHVRTVSLSTQCCGKNITVLSMVHVEYEQKQRVTRLDFWHAICNVTGRIDVTHKNFTVSRKGSAMEKEVIHFENSNVEICRALVWPTQTERP